MDWERIEKEINYHTTIFSQEKSFTQTTNPNPIITSTPARPIDYYSSTSPSINNISFNQPIPNHQSFQDYQFQTRNSNTNLSNESNKKIIALRNQIYTLQHDIQSIVENKNDTEEKINDLEIELKDFSTLFSTMKQEKSNVTNFNKNIINKLSILDNKLKYIDDNYTSKEHLNEFLEVTADQIKNVRNTFITSFHMKTLIYFK